MWESVSWKQWRTNTYCTIYVCGMWGCSKSANVELGHIRICCERCFIPGLHQWQNVFFTVVEGNVEWLEIFKTKIKAHVQHEFVWVYLKWRNIGEAELEYSCIICPERFIGWEGRVVTCFTDHYQDLIEFFVNTCKRCYSWQKANVMGYCTALEVMGYGQLSTQGPWRGA